MATQVTLPPEGGHSLLNKLQHTLGIRGNNRSIEAYEILILATAVRIVAGKARGTVGSRCTAGTLDVERMILEALITEDARTVVAAIAKRVQRGALGLVVPRRVVIHQNMLVA
jgi:hypothetical protein